MEKVKKAQASLESKTRHRTLATKYTSAAVSGTQTRTQNPLDSQASLRLLEQEYDDNLKHLHAGAKAGDYQELLRLQMQSLNHSMLTHDNL